MLEFQYSTTWSEIKKFIDEYVKDDAIINYIDIEPDKSLYFAIIEEGKGFSIINGNATCCAKPYEYAKSILITHNNYGYSLKEISQRISKSEEEIDFYLQLSYIDPEKGRAEDKKITGREAKKLMEMDFNSRRQILTERYLQ